MLSLPLIKRHNYFMLQYNEATPGTYIIQDGEPYEVLSSHVFRKQQRKPVNQVKMRNLVTGKIADRSFHHTDKLEEAEIGTRTIKYLYTNRGESWFCEERDPSKRFTLQSAVVGSGVSYLKGNTLVEAIIFDERIISVRVPIKVELKVTQSAPAVRGNTAQGAYKEAVLETGATIQVPLFINEGDTVRINTETGEYVERAEKS